MEFREVNHSPGEFIQKKEKQKIQHFLPYNSPHEQETSSIIPDLLSPEGEEWLAKRRFDENSEPRKRIINLSSECTRTNPIGIGGMDGTKCETSEASNENLRDQAHCHYKQACCYNEQKEDDKAREEYGQAKKKYEDFLTNILTDDNTLQPAYQSIRTAIAMANLADIYAMERNFQQAVLWYQRVLPLCEEKLGKDQSGQDHNKTKEIRAKMSLGQQVGNFRLTQALRVRRLWQCLSWRTHSFTEFRRAIKILNQVRLPDQEDKDAFYKEARYSSQP